MWLKRSQPALSVRWREEGQMASNKQINPQDLNYVNVPNSIIEQGWFRREKAVRAWIFYLWHAILPRYEENRVKTIKRQTFTLKEGEMICTRSYLAECLGIHENIAKSSTDSLKRSKAIKVQQEVISKDIEKAPKNKLSRITVNGVPVPDEPYTKMYIPVDIEDMWTTPGLAQLYIYLLCTACHKETYMIGTGGKALLAVAGDVRLSYSNILNTLKCKEWVLKKNLRTLEEAGAIRRVERIGNKGVLVHLNYYPEHKQKEVKDTKVDELLELVTKPAKCQNVNNDHIPEANQKVIAKQPQTAVSPTPLPRSKPYVSEGDELKILDTPVTEAIKYLFFDLKRNKDIGYLNTIIDFINKELPAGFPMEELRGAMDMYYSVHGEKFIDKQILLKSLNNYNASFQQKQAMVRDNGHKIDEIQRKIDECDLDYRRRLENWALGGQAYKLYCSGNLSQLPEKNMSAVYYLLWTINQVSQRFGERRSVAPSPSKEDYQTLIEYFFSNIKSIEELRAIYDEDVKRIRKKHQSERESLVNELERLKKSA